MKNVQNGSKSRKKRAETTEKQAIPTGEPAGLDLSHIAEGLRALAFPIAELVPDAGNAKTHGDSNLDAIMGSFRQFGQTQALVVQRGSNLIRAGHGRLEAARRLYAAGDTRWAHLAVVFVDWDNVTGVAYAIADNRTAELAEWDKAALEKQLREINVSDEDLQAMLSQLAEDLELVVLPDEDAGDDGPAAAPPRYQIVVTCSDKVHQQELLKQFENDGLDCRAVKA